MSYCCNILTTYYYLSTYYKYFYIHDNNIKFTYLCLYVHIGSRIDGHMPAIEHWTIII